jgi:hypothetical protein
MKMMSKVLRKTELGQAEIRSKEQALDMRERRALILMDGSRDLAQVQAIIGASIEGIAKRLLHLGLVVDSGTRSSKAGQRNTDSMEFKDSVLGKTPATNFESFNHYLPTHSTAWKTGSYEQASASAPAFTERIQQPLTVALSPRGVLLGKMYLADLIERMMGKDDVFLRTKIQQIRDEEQLFTICEEVMEHIKGLTSADMLISMEKRFLECIRKK